MFLMDYLNDTEYQLLLNKYDIDYINSLDYKRFLEVYKIFLQYKFYYINDIILNYLEIFKMNPDDVLEHILLFKIDLGDNFVYLIGQNMKLLEEFIER